MDFQEASPSANLVDIFFFRNRYYVDSGVQPSGLAPGKQHEQGEPRSLPSDKDEITSTMLYATQVPEEPFIDRTARPFRMGYKGYAWSNSMQRLVL